MAKKYYHYFKVQGNYYFPLDMLRYDCCWPASSDDVSMIMSHNQTRTIVLCTIGHKDWKPTIDRWKSFGWNCSYDRKGADVQ